jgi:hypothetical protein
LRAKSLSDTTINRAVAPALLPALIDIARFSVDMDLQETFVVDQSCFKAHGHRRSKLIRSDNKAETYDLCCRGSATKLSLSLTTRTDSPEVSGIRPFLLEVHPKWSLVDPSNLLSGTPTRVFIGYSSNQLPVVFKAFWTLKSDSIYGSNFWMFGVAPGTSEKDVASLAMIKLTPGAQLAFTSTSVKALPAGYQWYQATQPIMA